EELHLLRRQLSGTDGREQPKTHNEGGDACAQFHANGGISHITPQWRKAKREAAGAAPCQDGDFFKPGSRLLLQRSKRHSITERAAPYEIEVRLDDALNYFRSVKSATGSHFELIRWRSCCDRVAVIHST